MLESVSQHTLSPVEFDRQHCTWEVLVQHAGRTGGSGAGDAVTVRLSAHEAGLTLLRNGLDGRDWREIPGETVVKGSMYTVGARPCICTAAYVGSVRRNPWSSSRCAVSPGAAEPAPPAPRPHE